MWVCEGGKGAQGAVCGVVVGGGHRGKVWGWGGAKTPRISEPFAAKP